MVNTTVIDWAVFKVSIIIIFFAYNYCVILWYFSSET